MFTTRLQGLSGYGQLYTGLIHIRLFQASHSLLSNQIFPQFCQLSNRSVCNHLEAARQNILTNIARPYFGLSAIRMRAVWPAPLLIAA